MRGLGRATASLRPLPDFLVLGVKRGGTTSMHRWLLTHPAVLPMFPSAQRVPMMQADRKGVHFLDAHWAAGPAWYRSHFPSAAARARTARRVGSPVVAGEATPYYLHHPLAADRARQALPDIRLLVLLRDPVERAWSHYKEQRRRGFEPLEDFGAALDAEAARTAGEGERLATEPGATSFAHEHQSYVATSRYAVDLGPWRAAFPADQLLVLRSEDLYAEPERTYGQVLDFFGLPPGRLAARPFNRTAGDLSPALRARLVEELGPDTAALEADLSRSFGWSTSAGPARQ